MRILRGTFNYCSLVNHLAAPAAKALAESEVAMVGLNYRSHPRQGFRHCRMPAGSRLIVLIYTLASLLLLNSTDRILGPRFLSVYRPHRSPDPSPTPSPAF